MKCQTIFATLLLGMMAPYFWRQALQAWDTTRDTDLPEDIRGTARRQLTVSRLMAVVCVLGAIASTISLTFHPPKQ
jgi:hypothetical protein